MLGLGNILTKGGAILKFPNEYSFNFDGSNDCLLLDSESGKELLNNGASGSISVWVYAETLGGSHDGNDWRYPTIISTGNVHMSLIVDKDGAVLGFFNDGSAVYNIKTADSIVSTGSWHHLAWTWNSSSSKLYVNGTERYSGDYTPYDMGSGGNNDPVYIGSNASKTADSLWDGFIDEVAVWRGVELSASTVGKLASKPVDLTKYSASNLKLWLRAGDKVEPESTTSIARADYSAELDGSNDYIDCGASNSIITGTNITLSCWFKSADTDDSKLMQLKRTSSSSNLSLDVNVGGSAGHVGAVVRHSSGGTTVSADGSVDDGAWHHLALTTTSSAQVLYLDGVSIATGTVALVDEFSADPFTIGGQDGSNYNFGGNISSVSVHQTALPANDIALMAKSRFRPTRDYMLKQVDFDGSNDYITIPSFPLTGTHTFSMWVKPNDNTGSGVNELLYLKNDADNCLLVWHTGTGNSDGKNHFTYRVRANGNQNQAKDSTNEYQGEWILLTGVNSSSGTKLYVNGSEVASVSGDKTDIQSGSTNDYYIGYPSNSADGSIISFGFYNDAKDADFIYAQYAKGLFGDWSADTNLSGYWKMGNGTGDVYPTIVDQSSNSNNGTITNGASDDIVQNMVAGYDLGSYNTSSVATTVDYLDFTSGSVGSTSPITAFGTNSFSVSTWVNASGSFQSVFMTETSASTLEDCFILTVNMGTYIGIGDNNSWHHRTHPDSVGTVANTWHLITYVREGTGTNESKFYVDGVLKDTDTNSTNYQSADGWKIGFGAYGFTGLIKELAVFHNKALTASEVLAQYNNGIENDFTTSGMTHHWLLNSAGTVVDLVGGNNGTGSSVSLYSYYKDGNDFISPVEDTKNAVIDVSNPVLGTEVNTLANALSPSNETDATTGLSSLDSNITSVSDVTYSGNYSIKFETDANAEWVSATSNFTVENGKCYKFSVTWKTASSSHAMKHLIGTSSGNSSYVNIEGVAGSTDWVTTDYYFITTATTLNFKFAEFTGDSNIIMYIDNISIKKVQGNVGTPTSMDATNFPYTSILPDQSFLTGVNSAYNFIDLDGSDEYIDCGDGTSLDTTSAMTLSVWFKRDGTTNDFLASRDDTSSNRNWSMYVYSNKLNFDFTVGGNGKGVGEGTTTLSADTWYHAVFTHDGSNQAIYINGGVENSSSHSGSIDNDDISLYLGRRASAYFNGKIGQTALWNKGLSATEVSSVYNLGRHGNLLDSYSDNLVGYWAMGALDAKTGLSDVGNGTIDDRSGESNHGTASSTESADLNLSPNAEPEGYDIESTTRTETTP